MKTGRDLTKCLAFIGCQLNPAARQERHLAQPGLHPAVTISRQTGSGAMEIGQKLSDFLQARIPGSCGWAVFDKNLVTKMIEDHNLPKRLAEFLPEDRISRIKDMMEEVLGLHPPSDTLIHQISETVVHLAELGHVILVGRAAHVITRQAQNVFHVRLIAPMEKRQAQVMARRQMDPEAALDFIKKEDAARKHYLKAYFQADPDDDLLYDLVINTARFSPEEAATLIGEAVLAWAKRPGRDLVETSANEHRKP